MPLTGSAGLAEPAAPHMAHSLLLLEHSCTGSSVQVCCCCSCGLLPSRWTEKMCR